MSDSRVAKIVAIGFLEDWAVRSIKAFEAAGLQVIDPDRRSDMSYQVQHLERLCSDGDCVRDYGHDGQHYNIAGQPI